jgi:hypothetical protein
MSRLDEGLVSEEILAELWCQKEAPGAYACKTSRYAEIDRVVVYSGTALHYLEIKTRSGSINDYPTTIVKLSKHLAAQALRYATGLPTYLLVVWSDGARVFRLDEPPDEYLPQFIVEGHRPADHCAYHIARGRDLSAVFAAYTLRRRDADTGRNQGAA